MYVYDESSLGAGRKKPVDRYEGKLIGRKGKRVGTGDNYAKIFRCPVCNRSWQKVTGVNEKPIDYFPSWISYDEKKICPECGGYDDKNKRKGRKRKTKNQ